MSDPVEKTIDIIQDEMTETPGGHWEMFVDVDKTLVAALMNQWIEAHCNDATIEQYYEVLENSKDIKEALHSAIVNEILLDALRSQIAVDEARIENANVES